MAKDLTEALRALTEGQNNKPQDRPAERGAARRVVAAAPPPGSSKGGGGGIASPLTELDASLREYWPTGWRTTDGLFEFPAIKKIVMADANSDSVEFRFADPTP